MRRERGASAAGARRAAAGARAAARARTRSARTRRWARTARAGTPGPPAPTCASTCGQAQLTHSLAAALATCSRDRERNTTVLWNLVEAQSIYGIISKINDFVY